MPLSQSIVCTKGLEVAIENLSNLIEETRKKDQTINIARFLQIRILAIFMNIFILLVRVIISHAHLVKLKIFPLQLCSNNVFLDFRCSFINLCDPGITVEAFNWVLGNIPNAPVNLNRFVGYAIVYFRTK